MTEMNEEYELTDRELAIEYGHHIKGILPCGTVTGVLTHNGEIWKSYVETGNWGGRHEMWDREYTMTPLRNAFQQYINGEEIFIEGQVAYNGRSYDRAKMVSAGMGGWRFEYRRKIAFKKAVLSGEISLPAPAIFNRYGGCYIEEGYEEDVIEKYWEFVDANYENLHSHHEVTA